MRNLRCLSLALSLLAVVAGCGDDRAPVTPDEGVVEIDGGTIPDAGRAVPNMLGPAERRADFVVPPAHDGVARLPLMVLLHGYSASASIQDLYFRASITARAMGYYLILPDGTLDSRGNRFWNATPACCNFGGEPVDDVAYITSLMDEAESLVPVDTTRVYVYGHSNGGFMSYRLACELSDRITAIVSLAGADYLGATDCVPSQPVSVLQVHGTLDETIAYAGTSGYPAARDTVKRWAERAGCDPAMSSTGTALDLMASLPGDETTVEQWTTGCGAGLDAELWTIQNGTHVPMFTSAWPTSAAEWLLRHHR